MAQAEEVVTKTVRQLNEPLYTLRCGHVLKLAEVVSLGKIEKLHKRHILPGLKSVATSQHFAQLFISLEEKIAAAYGSLPYEADVIQKCLMRAKPTAMRKLIEDEAEAIPETHELLDWFSAIRERPKQVRAALQVMLAKVDFDFDPETHDLLSGAIRSLERVLARCAANVKDAERLKVLGFLREHIDSPLLLERGSTIVTEAEVSVAKRRGRPHSARLYLLSNCLLIILAHDKGAALQAVRRLGRALTRAVGGGGGGGTSASSAGDTATSEGSVHSVRELPDGTLAGGGSGVRSRRVFHDCVPLLRLRIDEPGDEACVGLTHCPARGAEFAFDVHCKGPEAAAALRQKLAAQVAQVAAQEAEAKTRLNVFRSDSARAPSAPPAPASPGSPYASADAIYSGLSPRGSGGGAEAVDALARRLAAQAASVTSSTASSASSATSFRQSRPLPPVPPCPPCPERITAYSPASMLPPRPPGPATPSAPSRYRAEASPGTSPSDAERTPLALRSETPPPPRGPSSFSLAGADASPATPARPPAPSALTPPYESPSRGALSEEDAERAAEAMSAVCGAIRRGQFRLRNTPNKKASMCRREGSPSPDEDEL